MCDKGLYKIIKIQLQLRNEHIVFYISAPLCFFMGRIYSISESGVFSNLQRGSLSLVWINKMVLFSLVISLSRTGGKGNTFWGLVDITFIFCQHLLAKYGILISSLIMEKSFANWAYLPGTIAYFYFLYFHLTFLKCVIYELAQ